MHCLRARRLAGLLLFLVGCGDEGAATSDTPTSGTTEGASTSTSASTESNATTSVEGSSTGADATGPTDATGATGATGSDDTGGSDTTADDTTAAGALPDAMDDTYYATQDVELVADAGDGVVVNDVDPEGSALVVTDFDAVSSAGGTVTVAADGGFAYTPALGFWGPDSFGYTVEDVAGGSASATVTIHVAPVQVSLAAVAAGIGGFVVDGEAASDQSAFSVRGAGDVDGDGLDDLIVGAFAAGGSSTGRSYVVFGKADTTPVELAMLGDGGFTIDGEDEWDRLGTSVSGAGDVDGDGLDDLVVGGANSYVNAFTAGRSYVVFGKADTTPVALAMLGDGGFVMTQEQDGDLSGSSVRGAGDVDGDGLDDVIVGASAGGTFDDLSGRSYVVFGKADAAQVDLAALGAGGFVIAGDQVLERSGIAVSGAGDVDGDGLGDLVVSGASDRSFVVLGKADTTTVDLGMLGAGGFILEGGGNRGYVNGSVSGGDLDGDGRSDVVVGVRGAGPNGAESGRTFVVFGGANPGTVDLDALDSDGFVLDGEAADDWSGSSVDVVGDVNGDGLADLVIGAAGADPSGPSSGRSYVVFGVPTGED